MSREMRSQQQWINSLNLDQVYVNSLFQGMCQRLSMTACSARVLVPNSRRFGCRRARRHHPPQGY
jgi:hypothetical protein